VIYPNVFWRGILPDNVIAKNKAGNQSQRQKAEGKLINRRDAKDAEE